MKITKRQLQRIINEELATLHEDHVDTELDNLKKNITNDIEHIRDLKDDIHDDHEEELRAEKEKKKHESLTRLTARDIRKIVKEESAKKHPLSDLARRQGSTMGGSLVDPEGFYSLVQKGIDFANGNAGSALKLSESDIKKIVKEEKRRLARTIGRRG
jgi:hypothetical protein